MWHGGSEIWPYVGNVLGMDIPIPEREFGVGGH
jgi:hypothetical protein